MRPENKINECRWRSVGECQRKIFSFKSAIRETDKGTYCASCARTLSQVVQEQEEGALRTEHGQERTKKENGTALEKLTILS